MPKLTILFDGHCQFCMASVRLVKTLDWLNRIELKDAQLDKSYHGIPVDKKKALLEVHVWDGKISNAGYFAFRRISWSIPLFWPLIPFLYIPGVPFIGKRVYGYISANRLIFGCNSESCKIHPNHKQNR